MLRTVQSLPLAGLSTLGFDPARFQPEPPVCYRASWQLPGPDLHRLATTSTNTEITPSGHEAPPVLLGARMIRARRDMSLDMEGLEREMTSGRESGSLVGPRSGSPSPSLVARTR